MKTLITGGKSAQALKLLKAFTGDQILLGDYGDLPAMVSAQYQLVELGPRNDDTIAHNLLNACLDQEAGRLLPLHSFELEAVAKSAVLFEEFNVHILLPDAAVLPSYLDKVPADKKNWAVFERGSLIYATTLSPALLEAGENAALNGAFYFSEAESGIDISLFKIG